MMKDITPELLEKLQKEFSNNLKSNKKISKLYELVKMDKASYKEANQFAIEIGEILADVFKQNLSSSILPDGKMYYNIAERIINTTFKNNHKLVSEFTEKVQTTLNKEAGLGIKSIKPELNQDRIDGIVDRLSNEEMYDDVAWILEEPTVNFSQSIVDDAIKANAMFHSELGLKATVTRLSTGKCCAWCDNLVGKYEYPNVPEDIYRRHQRCKCTVDYNPGDGRKQDVWTKNWN